MNDLRKAAEQALDALRYTTDHLPAKTGVERYVDDAITALHVALMQLEQEPLGGEWVPCVKLPVVVHVRNQRDGETHISTREGITPVLAEDLILRGVVGEEYPIGRELFERTYTFETKPPKRKWVGLTDEERGEAVMKELTAHDRYQERQRIAQEQHIKRTRTHET